MREESLVRYVGRPQLTFWVFACGDGEVSLELGSEAVCRRVRLEGGANRGLLGLLASLLGSLCSSEFRPFLDDDLVLEINGSLRVSELFLVLTMFSTLDFPH